MAELRWDDTGTREYETGCSNGVLYPWVDASGDVEGHYGAGVAWNGLTGVTESPSGGEASKLWADNINYLNMYSAEEFGGTIEAYMYPDAFKACNGEASLATGLTVGQQARKSFAMVYKTVVGNDTEGDAHGYKIHILYGCKVSPSERAYQTINDSPEAITMSWEFTSTPINVAGYKPTAYCEIDSTLFTTEALQAKLEAIEGALFGTATADAGVLTPDEIKAIINGTTPPVTP